MIEILDGDAKGSKIIISFTASGSETRITVNAEGHFRGILIPFAYLTRQNYESAMNTIINEFVTYTKNHDL